MAHLSLSLLGPLRASLDGEPLTHFHSDTALALLVYLAMNASTPCRRTSLAGLLWSDYDESSALTNLRQALRRLRIAIKDHERTTPLLQVTHTTIALDPGSDYWLDVDAFSEALDAVQHHAHASLEACAACAERLSEAVELYRGEYLSGFSLDSALFEEWMVVERERLHGQAMEVLGHLTAYHTACGQYEQAARYARRQLALEPWHEEGHRELMHALALGGQRSAALAQYETCCCTLRDELDVEPGKETTRLYERIRDGQDLTGFPKPVRSAEPSNLPVQLAPFVGREAELAHIGERLQDPSCRLLTLVGPGGSGKTRLALEVATQQVERYRHGVWFVPLAPLRAVESIVPTIAGSLGFTFHGQAEPKTQLLDYLRGRNLVLLLDNAEHLIREPVAGIASIATDVLKSAPGVKVLVTSRAGLHVQGEHRFAVEGMDVPPFLAPQDGRRTEGHPGDGRRGEGEYSAVKLFLQSARRTQSDFELSDEILPDVVRICQLVEGMPLGILLAAAWLALFTPGQIAAQIRRNLDFLESDDRDMPERQRSLRAAFDHSWNLLDEREREVFSALSVFRGGFTWEAAREVAGASPRELLALVDKSLLHCAAEGRYEVHELLRQYAAEHLATSPDRERAICDRHTAYYAAALERWAIDMKGPRQQTALAEMDAEIEDARAAWDWAAQQRQVERLAQAMDGLGWFYVWRARHPEGEIAFRTAAETLATGGPNGSSAHVTQQQTLVRLLAWQSIPSLSLGYTETAQDLSRQSLALLEVCERAGGDVRLERAYALWAAGLWADLCSDRREARALLEQSLDLYRALGARWETASVLSWLAETLQGVGLNDQAAQARREALAIYRQLGDERGIADSLRGLGWGLLDQGDLAEAERLMRECIALYRSMSDPVASGAREASLSSILVCRGRFAEAYLHSEAALAVANEMVSDPALAVRALGTLGEIDLHMGQYTEARRKAQAALDRAQHVGHGWLIGYVLWCLGLAAAAEGAYVEAQRRLQESLDQFQRTQTQAQMIVVHAALASVALLQGQADEALAHLLEALSLLIEYRSFVAALSTLPFVALLLAKRGQAEHAAEVYALASRYPYVANSHFWEDVVGKHVAAATASLPPEVVAAAQERGRTRDLWATVEELLAELEEMENG